MGVHLILWILAVLVVSFQCLELSSELYCRQKLGDGEDSYYRSLGWCGSSYDLVLSSQGVANWFFGVMKALTAFSVMLLILHFTLFVMACIETDRRSRHEKKRKIIYLVAAPGVADGRMYYAPLDQPPPGIRGSVLAPSVLTTTNHL